MADIASALMDDRFGGLRGRAIRAFVGWLPIALGLGWIVGELTGCGRFAASCDSGVVEPMLWLTQAVILALLALVPAAAAAATMATLTLLVASVGASLVLSATGAAADGGSREAALGVVLVAAWVVGLVVAVVRRSRTPRRPASPVS